MRSRTRLCAARASRVSNAHTWAFVCLLLHALSAILPSLVTLAVFFGTFLCTYVIGIFSVRLFSVLFEYLCHADTLVTSRSARVARECRTHL